MTEKGPLISIIIPCRNEAQHLNACMSSIFANLPVPGGFEVFVVDGMSDDGTADILSLWSKRRSELRILKNPQRIVPTAMNLGIRLARGQWIVRLDAHSTYPLDYLSLCVETALRTHSDNVGGVFNTLPGRNSRQSRLVQALTTHRFGVGNAQFRLNAAEGPVDTVPYGCYRRDVFDRIGLYDERLVRNQDYEFNRRLLRAGGRVWCNPAIFINYYNQARLSGLIRQALVTGRWNPWMWYLAPYTIAYRHVIPAVFLVAIITAPILCVFMPVALLLVGCALVAYSSLAFVASYQQSRRLGFWWMLPILPWLFLAYHVAYGLGILQGMFQLVIHRAPVQSQSEPWPGAGRYRL